MALHFRDVACLHAIVLAFAVGPVASLTAQQVAAPAPTLELAALQGISPAMECEKLVSVDISPAVGSPTHILTAKSVKDAKPAPYCDVVGYVELSIKFEVRLPLEKWTQRFVQTGCGGLCGHLDIHSDNDQGCMPATNGELVLASTDMGHEGSMDGSFGAKDYQLRIDFAYRGVHVATLAAKALIEKYYGHAPKYSYFSGCSDGGREALMEAERFPNDFNGITAGAPAMNFTTQNTFYHGWNVIANLGPDGKSLLTAEQLPILHKAVVAQCDELDGLKDGLIGNPLACHPDLSAIECKAEQDQTTCLTHAQAEVALALYAGAHDSEGNKLVLSGPLPGSELAWAGVLIPATPTSAPMSRMASTGPLQNLVYEKNPPANYRLEDLAFTKPNFEATTKLHSLYDATDPDLTRFASAGGKLILWHGLADPHISPLNTIAYYTYMQQLMGAEKVDSFARLYLFPGGYHCGGGEGPFDFNLLASMMAWVEKSQAPNELIASHSSGGRRGPIASVLPGGPRGPGGPDGERMTPPPGAANDHGPIGYDSKEPARIDRTRPVFPYPYMARYAGSGSIDDASNFVKGDPQPASAESLKWLGTSFYAPHYEQWCVGKGAAMTCTSTPQK